MVVEEVGQRVAENPERYGHRFALVDHVDLPAVVHRVPAQRSAPELLARAVTRRVVAPTNPQVGGDGDGIAVLARVADLGAADPKVGRRVGPADFGHGAHGQSVFVCAAGRRSAV